MIRERLLDIAQRFISAEPKVERQELWCHDCESYVQFNIDLSLNGNHVLECPKCSHEHCRVVRNGVITDIRWDSRNGPTIAASGTSWTTFATTSTSTSSTYFLGQSWLTTGTAT